uniref:Gamma-glutamylcyclotransferase AIG2-like domain-containing protein n=1 Tax=Globodera rostochiensis TaxID=31243 RepID=A0A914HQX4_GLORO
MERNNTLGGAFPNLFGSGGNSLGPSSAPVPSTVGQQEANAGSYNYFKDDFGDINPFAYQQTAATAPQMSPSMASPQKAPRKKKTAKQHSNMTESMANMTIQQQVGQQQQQPHHQQQAVEQQQQQQQYLQQQQSLQRTQLQGDGSTSFQTYQQLSNPQGSASFQTHQQLSNPEGSTSFQSHQQPQAVQHPMAGNLGYQQVGSNSSNYMMAPQQQHQVVGQQSGERLQQMLSMQKHALASGGGGNQPPQMQAGTLGLPVGNSSSTYNMAQPQQQQQNQGVAQHPQLQQQQQQAISSPTGNMSFDMNTFFAATQQQQPMANVGNQIQYSQPAPSLLPTDSFVSPQYAPPQQQPLSPAGSFNMHPAYQQQYQPQPAQAQQTKQKAPSPLGTKSGRKPINLSDHRQEVYATSQPTSGRQSTMERTKTGGRRPLQHDKSLSLGPFPWQQQQQQQQMQSPSRSGRRPLSIGNNSMGGSSSYDGGSSPNYGHPLALPAPPPRHGGSSGQSFRRNESYAPEQYNYGFAPALEYHRMPSNASVAASGRQMVPARQASGKSGAIVPARKKSNAIVQPGDSPISHGITDYKPSRYTEFEKKANKGAVATETDYIETVYNQNKPIIKRDNMAFLSNGRSLVPKETTTTGSMYHVYPLTRLQVGRLMNLFGKYRMDLPNIEHFVLEKARHMELELQRQRIELDSLKIEYKTNQRIQINLEEMEKQYESYWMRETDDPWEKQLKIWHESWSGVQIFLTETDKEKKKTIMSDVTKIYKGYKGNYFLDLFVATALSRTALLRMTMYNSTRGTRGTDCSDLIELMITMSLEEREQVGLPTIPVPDDQEDEESRSSRQYKGAERFTKNKKDQTKTFCSELDNESELKYNADKAIGFGLSHLGVKSTKWNAFGYWINHMCRHPRTIQFDKETRHMADWVDELDQFLKDLNFTKDIMELFTEYSYSRLRLIFDAYQSSTKKSVYHEIKEHWDKRRTKKSRNSEDHYVQLVNSIVEDVYMGRPYFFARLLSEKFPKLLDNSTANDQDAFSDITRILLHRGPVDLVEVNQEYLRMNNKVIRNSKDAEGGILATLKTLAKHAATKSGSKDRGGDEAQTLKGFVKIMEWSMLGETQHQIRKFTADEYHVDLDQFELAENDTEDDGQEEYEDDQYYLEDEQQQQHQYYLENNPDYYYAEYDDDQQPYNNQSGQQQMMPPHMAAHGHVPFHQGQAVQHHIGGQAPGLYYGDPTQQQQYQAGTAPPQYHHRQQQQQQQHYGDQRQQRQAGGPAEIVVFIYRAMFLFVYGTLRKGFDGEMAHKLASESEWIGKAMLEKAQLYRVYCDEFAFDYPALVLLDNNAHEECDKFVVVGDLVRLTNAEQSIIWLDEYEECGAQFKQPNEYVKKEVKVKLLRDEDSNEHVQNCVATTYVFGWPIKDSNGNLVPPVRELIVGGDWLLMHENRSK